MNSIVSFDSEPLILVNSDDQEIGQLDKGSCHDGQGILHRAFSVFLFNSKGELLLQQRHPTKRLWGGFWANTCCSHPRAGETLEIATQRRLEEELGLSADLTFVYKFEYHATFGDLGSEHELCHVFVGTTDEQPQVNPTEIAEIRYLSVAELDRELAEHPEQFTPWLKLEWQRLRTEFNHLLP